MRLFITLFIILFTINKGFSQQILASKENQTIWEDFYLYPGDKIKFDFSGSNKKFNVYFSGPSVTYSKEFADYFTKVPDINNHVIEITKEGPHSFGQIKLGAPKGVMKMVRIPATGKEYAPTTFVKQFDYSYSEVPQNKPQAFKTFYTRNVLNYDIIKGHGNKFIFPKDKQLSFIPTPNDEKRAAVVVNEEVKFWKLYNLIKNQEHFSFQKGDTVYFEIKPKENVTYNYVWVARADQVTRMNPDLFLGGVDKDVVRDYLFEYVEASPSMPISGSFLVENDGLFGFYFQKLIPYDIKILRFPGKGNDPKHSTLHKLEIAPVSRSKDGNFQLEPILK